MEDKMRRYMLFDLDGTLMESADGIVNSVKYALEKCGVNEPDRANLLKFIGPPLRDSFRKFYGFTAEQAEEAVGYYREYYAEKGIFAQNSPPNFVYCSDLVNIVSRFFRPVYLFSDY